MKMKWIAGILLTLMGSGAHAGSYKYHPDSWLHLGKGINPFYPSNGYADCIAYDGEARIDNSGVRETTATLSLVKTREDFYNLTQFSASIAGSYKFVSGSGSYRSEKEDTFHSDSLTWIIFFESQYGIFGMRNPRLKPEYVNLDADSLYATCGSEVVKSHKKVAMAYALFTLHNVSEAHRHEIESHLSGGAQTGIWSAKMESSFNSVLRSASAASNLTVQIRAIGGNGISDLSDLAEQKDPNEDGYAFYQRVPAILKKYVEGLNAQTASASEFETASIKVYKPTIPMRFADFKSGVIGMMFTGYQDAESIYKRASGILTGDESVNYQLTSQETSNLQRAIQNATEVMNTITTSAEPCFVSGQKCVMPTMQLLPVRWPHPIRLISLCEYTRILAVEAGCIDSHLANTTAAKRSMPVCTSFDPGMSAQFSGWKQCSAEQLVPTIRFDQ